MACGISILDAKFRDVTEVKRLIESLQGDPAAREAAELGKHAKKEKLAELGIHFDTDDVGPLWEKYNNLKLLFESGKLKEYPLLYRFWDSYLQEQEQLKELSLYNTYTKNDALTAWRTRIFQRSSSEAGGVGRTKIQPLFAYELSKGCSVGCWFCALAPGKLKGVVPYTAENARLWKDMLEIGQEMFGQCSAVSSLYHATEPFDNPDYFKFVDDFQMINGILPQTTTAVPFRNPEQTKGMLKRRRASPDMPDRFSVLNLKTLRRIHREFSAVDLEYVQLVLQNQESFGTKAKAGRARNANLSHIEGVKEDCVEGDSKEMIAPTTVECVIGFLVNLYEGSIKLISPCKASEKWPFGYRVHYEAIFRDKDEYKAILQDCIEKCMRKAPAADMPLAFRPDLQYQRRQDGFSLISPYRQHDMCGRDFFPYLGDAIAEGNTTSGEIAVRLAEQGFPYFSVIGCIQDLFKGGVLADELDMKSIVHPPPPAKAGADSPVS